ncbi:MAG: hypothetical protein RL757_1958 [Bacteroidota bacterium]|jgi:hypothetical protein
MSTIFYFTPKSLFSPVKKSFLDKKGKKNCEAYSNFQTRRIFAHGNPKICKK